MNSPRPSSRNRNVPTARDFLCLLVNSDEVRAGGSIDAPIRSGTRDRKFPATSATSISPARSSRLSRCWIASPLALPASATMLPTAPPMSPPTSPPPDRTAAATPAASFMSAPGPQSMTSSSLGVT